MVFTIMNFNKQVDIYTVESDKHEKQCVNAAQIVQVMLKGYHFTNAKLTKKGFAISTDKGTRFVKVEGLSRQVYAAMSAKIDSEKAAEESKKHAMTQAIQSTPRASTPTPTGRKKVSARPNKDGIETSVQKKIKYEKPIIYMGNTYFSTKQLCKAFNRDLSTYETLRAKGYSMGEALGKIPLRPESELQKDKESRQDIGRALDNLAYQRGEY